MSFLKDNDYKEVRFDKYCETCENKNLSETSDICDECLSNPTNLNSEKPINWKQDASSNKKKGKK